MATYTSIFKGQIVEIPTEYGHGYGWQGEQIEEVVGNKPKRTRKHSSRTKDCGIPCLPASEHKA